MKSSFDSHAVIGLGFGDEGKGAFTSSLVSSLEDPIVIRFSGGQQAGHTVVNEKGSHVFANFGSGTLQGIPTYWSRFCSFDPAGVMNEYDLLVKKGYKPTLFVDKNAPMTTPYDKYWNQKTDDKNGTCGVGVGATFQREEDRYSLLVGDLLSPSVVETKLGLIESYYLKKSSYAHTSDEEVFLSNLSRFFNCPDIKIVDEIPTHKNYVFEGSQGLLLDQNFGFFPHVTRSNTGTKNILSMGVEPYIYLITRAFQTRHGNGPMTNEDIPHNIKENPFETNVKNKYQGKLRKSLLDLDLLKYGIEKDLYLRKTKNKELVITCTDLIEGGFRYTYKGTVVEHKTKEAFARSIADHLGIKKVTTTSSPIHQMEK